MIRFLAKCLLVSKYEGKARKKQFSKINSNVGDFLISLKSPINIQCDLSLAGAATGCDGIMPHIMKSNQFSIHHGII